MQFGTFESVILLFFGNWFKIWKLVKKQIGSLINQNINKEKLKKQQKTKKSSLTSKKNKQYIETYTKNHTFL